MATLRKSPKSPSTPKKETKSPLSKSKEEEGTHICFVGGQCGKSALINRFLYGNYVDVDEPTVEDYHRKKVQVYENGPEELLQVLDISGNDFYNNLHKKWWEWGDLFVFVFSIVDKHSFKLIDSYWKEISSFKKVKRIPMVIVGTQDDLENKRQVTFAEGDALALRYQCPFVEVSAKTGHNLPDLFKLIFGILKKDAPMPSQSQIFNKERRNTLVIDAKTQSVILSPPKPSHQQIQLQRKIKELEEDVKLYEDRIVDMNKNKVEFETQMNANDPNHVKLAKELKDMIDDMNLKKSAIEHELHVLKGEMDLYPPSPGPSSPLSKEDNLSKSAESLLQRMRARTSPSMPTKLDSSEKSSRLSLQMPPPSSEQESKISPEQMRANAAIVLQKRTRGWRARRNFVKRVQMNEHRINVINEILVTEIHYVNCVKEIVDLYMKPLQKRAIFSADDLRVVFSDVEIILGANSKLLSELESRTKVKHPSIMIGDVFLQMSPALRVYTQFVNNYEIALKKIKDFHKNPEYIDFLEGYAFSLDHLEALLIMPVQRITRYALLLQDLLKSTWKDHRDYANLEAALQKMKETTNFMNEKKRESENVKRIFAIASSFSGKPYPILDSQRRLIKEGDVTVWEKKKGKLRRIILFNDIVIVVKKEKRLGKETGKIVFQEAISLRDASVMKRDNTQENQFGMAIISPVDSLMVTFSNQTERTNWVNAVQNTISLFNESLKFREQKTMKVAQDKADRVKDVITRQYSQRFEKGQPMNKTHVRRKSLPIPEEKKE